jgi:hypothetical protein
MGPTRPSGAENLVLIKQLAAPRRRELEQAHEGKRRQPAVTAVLVGVFLSYQMMIALGVA